MVHEDGGRDHGHSYRCHTKIAPLDAGKGKDSGESSHSDSGGSFSVSERKKGWLWGFEDGVGRKTEGECVKSYLHQESVGGTKRA